MLLFAVGLFLIGDRRMLFSDTFEVYAEFKQIAGARERRQGARRGHGRRRGRGDQRARRARPGRFRVQMRVREDLHPLIRIDSVASIQNDGLVGNKFVQIETGTEAAPQVPDQGTIQSREPFDIADLMLAMSDTIVDREHDARGGQSGVDRR